MELSKFNDGDFIVLERSRDAMIGILNMSKFPIYKSYCYMTLKDGILKHFYEGTSVLTFDQINNKAKIRLATEKEKKSFPRKVE